MHCAQSCASVSLALRRGRCLRPLACASASSHTRMHHPMPAQITFSPASNCFEGVVQCCVVCHVRTSVRLISKTHCLVSADVVPAHANSKAVAEKAKAADQAAKSPDTGNANPPLPEMRTSYSSPIPVSFLVVERASVHTPTQRRAHGPKFRINSSLAGG